jgi:hypothetical protein
MPWQVGMTERPISGATARATGKSTIRYDLIAAGEVLGGGAARQKSGFEHRILLSSTVVGWIPPPSPDRLAHRTQPTW